MPSNFDFLRDHQYLDWKYFKNPAGKALSALALNNGRVVGQVGGIPVRFSGGGRETIGVQVVDSAIFEQHRRYDLLLGMARSPVNLVAQDLEIGTGRVIVVLAGKLARQLSAYADLHFTAYAGREGTLIFASSLVN